jgi:hypothetical protein
VSDTGRGYGLTSGIVSPKIASALKTAYMQKSGASCALLWMTFAGHGSDFYTYYNQIFCITWKGSCASINKAITTAIQSFKSDFKRLW